MMAICVSLKMEGSGFSCEGWSVRGRSHQMCLRWLTRSKQEPPPIYSMTIHSLLPRRKLALYWVTCKLAHVLSTEISA